MIEIIALLHCLEQCLDQTATRQMERIIAAVLAMSGRVTMLGISRWTEKGGSYRTVQRWFNAVLPWAQMSWLFFRAHILGLFPLTYLVLDGHFDSNNVCQIVPQSLGFHLISRLRHDSALYFQYKGEQKKSGPRRRYGDKLDYQAIPEQYRMASSQDKQIRTDIYQATMLHECFADPHNVMILVRTNLESGARAHAVLFSSDLELAHDTMIHYYRLRFPIEFNFRDAKQFWGVEDFMTIQETPVTNAVNLSLFMVNVSQRLLADFRRSYLDAGVLDLKAFFRGRKYAYASIELLPEPPSPDIIATIVQHVASIGAIHATHTAITQP